jgi:SAM-dependent methyltransferase
VSEKAIVVLVAARAMEVRRVVHCSDGAQGLVSLEVMDEEIRAYYETGVELDRLAQGYSRVEFARTKELLSRFLPGPRAKVLDVGGGPGRYAAWLADAGHEVLLVDASPLHVQQALELADGRFGVAEGDARSLDEPDGSYDVVLLLGPLYHLVERTDRLTALGEAYRVLRPGGLLAAAGISRFASLLDGLLRDLLDDRGWALVERDLADGVHLPQGDDALFTTAYFHLPDELRSEVVEAGFSVAGLFGVEGPGWVRAETLDDERTFANVVRVARAVEQEPAIIGASAHFLAIARRP